METSWLALQLISHRVSVLALVKQRLYDAGVLALALWMLIVASHPSVALAQTTGLVDLSIGLPVFVTEEAGLPVSGDREPTWVTTVPATAYTSDPAETDDTPFITASGTHVRHGVIAANFLKIGTRVRIPEIYGDQVFIVEDRMNPRYDKRIDIWMEGKKEARQFGIKQVKLEIF